MKAYSLDLRQRVVAAVRAGMSRAEALSIFQISQSTLTRYLKQYHTSDSLAARPHAGGPQLAIPSRHHQALTDLVTLDPDATLAHLCDTWAEQMGVRVSQATMCRTLAIIDLPRKKKSLTALERDEGLRCAYRLQLLQHVAEAFVVVDESGYNLDMTPRYGRAPSGVRVYEQTPRNTPPNTTLIAALSTSGMQAPLLLEGSVDHLVIEAYVEHILAPTLRRGQIVVFDNLSAHKRARLEPLLAHKQCEVWFLPAYSPDLTPIELAFAKIKQAVRCATARTKEALEAAIGEALATITSTDARAFFDHCGYLVSSPMLN